MTTYKKNDENSSDCGKDDLCSNNGTCDESGVVTACICKDTFYGSDCSQTKADFEKSQLVVQKLAENLIKNAEEIKPEEKANFFANLALVASQSLSATTNDKIATVLATEMAKPITDEAVG